MTIISSWDFVKKTEVSQTWKKILHQLDVDFPINIYADIFGLVSNISFAILRAILIAASALFLCADSVKLHQNELRATSYFFFFAWPRPHHLIQGSESCTRPLMGTSRVSGTDVEKYEGK